MMIANNTEINTSAVLENIKRLTNQTFKLLPSREENLDWMSPLNTIIEEFCGMNGLLLNYHPILFSLLCKLEGLKNYTSEESFYEYRRTVFECMSLIQILKESIEEEEVNK